MSQPLSTVPGNRRGVEQEDLVEISCDDCVMQNTDTCDDCVVSFICGRTPGEAVVIDVAELRAVRLMSEVGLVPPLRSLRRSG